MQRRTFGILSIILTLALVSLHFTATTFANKSDGVPAGDGIVSVRSAFGFNETVRRLRADVAAKGIRMFADIDQAQLAADAGIALRPSTLLIFGNPPLGIQFITAKSQAGLDWPVRLLVQEDEEGRVWARFTDFGWIARRHNINDREKAFEMASKVIASITSSVAAEK